MPSTDCNQSCDNYLPPIWTGNQTPSATTNVLTYNPGTGVLTSTVNGVVANTTITLSPSVSVQYRDEGTNTGTPNPTSINFVGAGVTATQSGSAVTVTIPGGSGTETPLTANDSQTIDFTTSGTANHTLTGVVRISTTANNALTQDAGGLFVPVASAGAQTPITVVDTNAINLTASGLDSHTVQADLVISPDVGNSAQVRANGLFVPTTSPASETPLVATDSQTIDFTTSGTNGHNLTGVVRVSTTAGNIITQDAGGLFATVTTGDLLADNTASVLTGTARLVGGNATVTVPLRINAGVPMTAPTTPGGYIVRSDAKSVVISEPNPGVLNLETFVGYQADTSATGDVTAEVGSNTQFTHFTTPFTANRQITLSPSFARRGAVIEVSTVNLAGTDILPGTTQLEVVDGFTSSVIDTITDVDVYAKYISTGTAWTRVA